MPVVKSTEKLICVRGVFGGFGECENGDYASLGGCNTCGVASSEGGQSASSLVPRPIRKIRERAWYPLFAHALN